MSIEIDWELSEAPAEDEGAPSPHHPHPLHSPGPQFPVGGAPSAPDGSGRRRSRWWLAVPVTLALVGALALNYVSGLGWQRISADIIALVRYEEQLSQQGDTYLVLRVQDYTNSQWMSVRSKQVDARQPAPLPVPVLAPGSATVEIGDVELIDPDWVRTEVLRQYETPDGQTVTFNLPQFYRRYSAADDWVRTGAPDSYWGTWQDWRAPHLFVRYSERDAALVGRIAPRLETLLGQACQLWGSACATVPPAKLFLSGYVGSLEYDPLANIRVRVEFGEAANGAQLPADYFLSVPSPHLAGEPADSATEQFLTEYLAVRLIASLADAVTTSQYDAAALTAEAVARLGLKNADPGYAAGRQPPGSEAGLMYSLLQPADAAVAAAPENPPAAGATLITRLRPTARLTTYTVQPGDTLLGIALEHAVPVETLARLNGLPDPDLIQVGTTLLIPPSGTQ